MSLALGIVPGALPLAAEDSPPLTGLAFRNAVDQPLAANWEHVDFRDVLAQIGRDQRVAILLDRRIDPNAQRPMAFANESLKEGLSRLTAAFGAAISLPDNVVYLGPPSACRALRTLIALRTAELTADRASLPKSRQALWLKRRTVAWNDLDSPRDILHGLESACDFRITNPEVIEHDLWARAMLPDVTGIEALSLILIQFDLTFAWQERGTRVELIPIPKTVRIERAHRVRAKPIDKLLSEWQAAWPQIDFRPAGREIVALATIEEHEELDAALSGRKPTGRPAVVPLDQRQFTLRIKDVSAKDLMSHLEKSGIVFEYDADALGAAGIDLARFIELDVRDLSAREFFEAVFGPLGARCAIEGVTVTLTPK